MRYSYKFKVKCVKMYKKGFYPPTPDGVTTASFRSKIREWVRRAELHGTESLQHMPVSKSWTADEKLNIVLLVLSGGSAKSVAIENEISHGQLCNWVKRYRLEGYEGLARKRGRPPKEKYMPPKNSSEELTESEREELIRLRAENEYIKAEIEVIKKEIALRHEKWAAELKAKKQRSSKNSAKKDTD